MGNIPKSAASNLVTLKGEFGDMKFMTLSLITSQRSSSPTVCHEKKKKQPTITLFIVVPLNNAEDQYGSILILHVCLTLKKEINTNKML